MVKFYQKITIFFLAFGLLGVLEKSGSREINFSESFQGWVLNLLQGEDNQAKKTNNIESSLPNYFTAKPSEQSLKNCDPKIGEPNFFVMGGGGNPSYNEIALEKNVLYFQRTLKQMGYPPSSANIFFANGNDGQATIRYLNPQRQEKFKVPNIPDLKGAATVQNLNNWINNIKLNGQKKPIFFYFTGHGILNPEDANNNALMLWGDTPLLVRDLSNMLDTLPEDSHIVTMMAQCYSGSFANFIYQDGNPNKPLALQTRCGFFATIKTLPSVGCTPEVNEADYRDYSSSFFAGLSGVNRIGKPVASADYNQDGRVSYKEAHAFAKVDEKTSDLPVSTSEAWLQQKVTKADIEKIVNQPIKDLQEKGRSEQKYVVNSLMNLFKFNPNKSYQENMYKLQSAQLETEVKQAYQIRLLMELINIGMEQKIRATNQVTNINILERLIQCESSSWK
jgi:hypothetical protein